MQHQKIDHPNPSPSTCCWYHHLDQPNRHSIPCVPKDSASRPNSLGFHHPRFRSSALDHWWASLSGPTNVFQKLIKRKEVLMFATFFISILSKKNKKTPNHFQGSSPSTRNRRVVCKDHCLSFLRPWFCWSYCNPAHAGQRKDLSQGLAAKAPYFRPTTVVEVSVPKLMWKGVEHIYIYIHISTQITKKKAAWYAYIFYKHNLHNSN